MRQNIGKIVNFIVVFSLFIFLASCLATQSLILEIPQPSGKELPESIQSLTLVTRTVDSCYKDYNSDSLQKIFYKKQFNYDTVLYDLQAVDTTLKALGELLFESGRYDFVIPENRFLPHKKNAFLSKEMPWDEVKALCDTFNTDAVVSLDLFNTRVSTAFDKESHFDPESGGFYSASTAQMQVFYEALFRVYDPMQERVLIREFFRDTLYWDDSDYSTRNLFERFTPVKSALAEAGVALALDFSDKIGTVWREERRNYFARGNRGFVQGARLIDSGKYEEALTLWKKMAEQTKSKSLKSKAQLNVAVAYELQGDIDRAILWALKSYNSMYRPISYEYLKILRKRKKEIQNFKK